MCNLNENNYGAYIVGGCVRDMLLGKTPKDWDIATSAAPWQVTALFKKVINTGVKHGTVTVMIKGEGYEVTTYRLDGVYEDHRRPSAVMFTDRIEEDLARRDFTINAMAFHPEKGYVDPFEGRADIKRRLIRAVGDPDSRFGEDALRMLRAVRFACQLGFKIEEPTLASISKNAQLIENISAERIREELVKAFTAPFIENAAYFTESHILPYALPCIENISARVLESIPIIKRLSCKKTSLVMALLFREDCEKALGALKFDNATIKETTALAKYLPLHINAAPVEIRRLLSVLGEDIFVSLMAVKEAALENMTAQKAVANEIISRGDPITLRDLDVNGYDLMAAGIKGKAIGECLNRLLVLVHQKPEMNEKTCLLNAAAMFFEDFS